jgi:hypothetical protein
MCNVTYLYIKMLHLYLVDTRSTYHIHNNLINIMLRRLIYSNFSTPGNDVMSAILSRMVETISYVIVINLQIPKKLYA